MSKLNVSNLTAEQLKGKVVFVRVDFNVPHMGSTITDDNRIVAAIPTIADLIGKGARLILASHLGKIDFKKEPEEIEKAKAKADLSIVVEDLKKNLDATCGHEVKVSFCPATRGEALKEAVASLSDGDVLVMQNTRYEKGETKNDPELSAEWAALADVYVNDAFGSDHRKHASTYGVPEILAKEGKPTAIGYLVRKELEGLGRCVDCPDEGRPYIAVLGGAKVSDKILVIESLLGKCDRILIGGAMAYTFYRAQGFTVGTSMVEEDQLEYARKILATGKVVIPVDNIVAEKFPESDDERGIAVPWNSIPDDKMGLDIGPATADLFSEILSTAKTIFWNGPMGVSEFQGFAAGTEAICRVCAENHGAFTVIGGGDSAAAAKKLGYTEKFTHVSTGGGASLELIQNDGHLPGIDIIEDVD